MGVFELIRKALYPTHQVSITLASKSFWEGSAIDGEVTVVCLIHFVQLRKVVYYQSN
jgi:hypothetical protein